MSQALLDPDPVASPCSKDAGKPDWLRARQQQAAAAFETTRPPTLQDEAWRYGAPKALDFSACTPADPMDPLSASLAREHSRRPTPQSGHLLFANDRVLEHSLPAQAGAVFLPLSESLKSHGEIIREHLMQNPLTTGSQKFALLHLASLRDGAFLYLPKGCRIKEPLHIFHWIAGAAQILFPHTLIIADEGSSATVVDWYASADDGRHMACAMSDLWIKKGASLEYLTVQQWNRQTTSVHSCSTHVGEDASALALGLHLGGGYSRSEHTSRLTARRARSEMYALTVADEKQHFDQRTLQDHASPDTYSNLLFKNALYDSSKTTFSGLIRVDEHSHRTDAYQKVRNLLLSEEAEANSLPGLEILADQVRCSHGATTGEINLDELFYLRSRGIPEKAAMNLITQGFLDEVLQKVTDAAVRDTLTSLLHARLGSH
jgi:Fe-S cluster assembly protein SufD